MSKKSNCVLITILIIILIASVSSVSQIKQNEDLKTFNNNNIIEQEVNMNTNNHFPLMPSSYKKIGRDLKLSDFNFIEINITPLDSILDVVGEENGAYGSGILNPYYELNDGSFVLLKVGQILDSGEIIPGTGYDTVSIVREIIVYNNKGEIIATNNDMPF